MVFGKISLLLLLPNVAYGIKQLTWKKLSHGLATECGQVLHVTESARIEYKIGEALNGNEICPFLVRFDGAAKLKFVADTDEPGLYGKVNVATLEVTDFPYVTLLRFRNLDANSKEKSVTLEGTIAIITFHSYFENDNAVGFGLNITRVETNDVILSPSSVHSVTSQLTSNFDHPSNGLEYSVNELSTFLLAPPNYAANYSAPTFSRLSYKEKSLELSCFDRVDVFSFVRVNSGRWIHHKVLCGGEGDEEFPYLGELVLVTLATDGTVTAQGFQIQHEFLFNKDLN